MKDNSKTLIKRVQKQRDKEYVPPFEPNRPYKRTFKKTRMSWPLRLLYDKKYDVFITIVLLFALAIIGFAFLLWHVVFPMLAKLMEVLF